MVERVEMGTEPAPEEVDAGAKADEKAIKVAESQQDLQIRDLNEGTEEVIKAEEKKYDPTEDSEDNEEFKIPEKFEGKSIEDVIKAYQELEKTKAQESEKKKEETPEEAKSKEEQAALVEKDFAEWNQEYVDNGGTITDETKAKITEKYKIPAEYVDTYVAGVNALKANFTADVLKSVEIESEDYRSMIEWASTNLTEKEIEVFDKATNGQSKESAVMAINDLKMKYRGGEPNLAGGEGNSGSGKNQDVYRSEREVTADMQSEKYQRGDTAFIKYVEEKLGRSEIFVGK